MNTQALNIPQKFFIKTVQRIVFFLKKKKSACVALHSLNFIGMLNKLPRCSENIFEKYWKITFPILKMFSLDFSNFKTINIFWKVATNGEDIFTRFQQL